MTLLREDGPAARAPIVGRLNYPGNVSSQVGWPIGPSEAGRYFTIAAVDVHPDGTSTAHLRHAVPGDFDRYAVRPTGAPE